MGCEKYDFVRNPVIQNQVFYLESTCASCGFSISSRTIEELIEQEELHGTQCSRSESAA